MSNRASFDRRGLSRFRKRCPRLARGTFTLFGTPPAAPARLQPNSKKRKSTLREAYRGDRPLTTPRATLPRRWPLLALTCVLLAVTRLWPAGAADSGNGNARPLPERARMLYVPMGDLRVLLEAGPRRVMLDREQYEALLAKSRREEELSPPTPVAMLAADYEVELQPGRAELTGTLHLEVLDQGLHAVPLDLAAVGLRSAQLDGQPAALGRGEDGVVRLFVEGPGRHELTLDLVAPVEQTAARQTLRFRLPQAPSSVMRLRAPGDVELKNGAAVVSRQVDGQAEVTRFELLPPAGDASLEFSLNSRLVRQDRVVFATSVIVDEITEAYERLHATFSFDVLHRPVDRFQFAVPPGFEVTDVGSDQLARWDVERRAENGNVLEVVLREPTTDTVVVNLSAVKTAGVLGQWSFPRLVPLEVAGQVAVLGVVAEKRLEARTLSDEGLIAIDTSVFEQTLPLTLLAPRPGNVSLLPIAAYYAPQRDYTLGAEFARPEAELAVTASVLLTIAEQRLSVRGGFAIQPSVEPRFSFSFSAPAGWHMTAVTGPEGDALPFERYGAADAAGRIHVTVPQGMKPGEAFVVGFEAAHAPAGWLNDWPSREIDFPQFDLLDATRSRSALAVAVADDLRVRPEAIEGLTPLDEAEKADWNLSGVPTTLAYRAEGTDYAARLMVERAQPRLAARTFSFFQVASGSLRARCEIIYQVDEAGTNRLSFALPAASTPESVAIVGLDGLELKQFAAEVEGDQRRWTVELAQRSRGPLRLACDFEQPLDEREAKGLVLPVVRALGTAYQSGFVAVEGDAELDVQVATGARRVDVGELAEADYLPGRRLLGAFAFVGEPGEVTVDAVRPPGYRLPASIVELAELNTRLGTDGTSQTLARFSLRTKAQVLEVQLPPGSDLWAAKLDDTPLRPQRAGERLLLNLPATGDAVHDLEIMYASPVATVALLGDVRLPAPSLRLRADEDAAPEEVPLVDLAWNVYPPAGYRVVRSRGSVHTDQIERPMPAAVYVAGVVYWLGGGIQPFCGGCGTRPRAAVNFLNDQLPTPLSHRPLSGKLEGHMDYMPMEEPTMAMDLEALEDTVMEEVVELDEDRFSTAPEVQPAQPAPEPAEARDRLPLTEVDAAAVPFDDRDPIVFPNAWPWRKPKARPDELLGVRSLRIDFQRTTADEAVAFRSLGVEPVLAVTLSNGARFGALAWAVGILTFVVGLLLTRRTVRCRAAYVVGVMVVASVLPALHDGIELAHLCNAAFFAVSALVPYYLFVALCRRTSAAACGCWRKAASPGAASVIVPALLAAMALAAPVQAQPRDGAPGADRYVVQIVEPEGPVAIPDDALVVPYDGESATGIRDATKVLVPYDRYVELWNRAYPDEQLEPPKPPADYAVAGAAYRAVLTGDDFLLVEGELTIDLFTDAHVEVPLALRGGVLARALLDGKPARLSVPQPAPQPEAQQLRQQAPQQQAARMEPPDGGLLVLHVSGKGRHKLEVSVRLRLRREGGWRVADGALPAAAAAGIELTVPEAETQLRWLGAADRAEGETEADHEVVSTVLGTGGSLSLRWRPKVTEAEVDRSLTAHSTAVMDVQENGLRVVWRVRLDFPRAQREQFTIEVPAEYLVKHVSGQNVRGWELSQADGRQSLEIGLLHAARDNEEVVLDLWREGPVGEGSLDEFAFPVVRVPGAVLEDGQLTVRRSPLLELRIAEREGVGRIDLGAEADQLAGGLDAAESPLGIRPYQAYRFATVPFNLSFAAAIIRPNVTARLQTVLRIAELERMLETRAVLTVQDRPLFRVDIVLPDDLRIDQVAAPGEFHWSETVDDGERVLSVYLASGRVGEVSVLVAGKLGETGPVKTLPLPHVALRGIERQTGEMAVQTDPGLRVDARDLAGCERILPKQLHAWLKPQHRVVTQLALGSSGPDYSATLVLAQRKPVVACRTISNAKVTTRSIEETILVEFDIREAGVRRVAMTLPQWMADCRVRVPLLRQKTIAPAGDGPDAPVRLLLEFQDEMMGELRVLVENDRLLTADVHEIAIPRVETGRTERQFVALESAGRDEVVVERAEGLEPLGRQQRDWQTLRSRLGDGITQAWTVAPGATAPRLAFQTRERKTVATAGAQVRLAETTLVVDLHGAYRAQVTMKVDNSTEQFLEVQLPPGATLWTARVAGEAVKPHRGLSQFSQPSGNETPSPDHSAAKTGWSPSDARMVRIPLVKTAAGDVAYDVVLGYGGNMPPLGVLGRVEFPLLVVHNLAVDRSQVRLLLPEENDWFDFEGTLGRPADVDTLAEGRAKYYREQVEELLGTLRHGSTFEKVRSAQNLKQLGMAMESYAPQSYRSSGRYESGGEMEASRRILQEAQKEVEQFDQGVQETIEFDNRYRMNEIVEQQQLSRSRNVVQHYDYNFDAETAAEPRPGHDAPGKGMELNAEWLNKSQLSNAPADSLRESGWSDEEKRRAGQPQSDGRDQFFRGKKGSAPKRQQPAAPQLKSDGDKDLEVEGRKREQAQMQQKAPQSSLQRYQQRLEEQTQLGQMPQADFGDVQNEGDGRRDTRQGGEVAADASSPQETFGLAVPQFGGSDTMSGPGGATEVAGRQGSDGGVHPTADLVLPLAPATGLASLDFTLPERGRQYVFTTTGGRLELRGRHVSRRLLWGLGRVAAVLASLAFGWLLLRAIRQGRFQWLSRPAGAAILALLGLASLLTGVFPILGFLAILAAIIIAMRRMVCHTGAAPAM